MKSIIEYKCKECGKVTKHYLSKTGVYKCLICGTANKKAPRDVVFEQDEELDAALNPE
jgi:ribosomal protein L37AE/L43A